MTVKELRQLLYDIDDQDAEVCIVIATKYGEVTATREPMPRTDDPKGFVSL